MYQRDQLFIDGKWSAAQDDSVITVISPHSGSEIGRAVTAGPADVVFVDCPRGEHLADARVADGFAMTDDHPATSATVRGHTWRTGTVCNSSCAAAAEISRSAGKRCPMPTAKKRTRAPSTMRT